MNSPSARTVTGPRPPELPPPHRLPLVATIAPLVVSLVLFAVTRSPYTLVFAALGPVVAIASTMDAWIQSRKATRREAVRFHADVVRVTAEIESAHRDEASTGPESMHELLARPAVIVERWRSSDQAHVRVGSGSRTSTLRYEQPSVASAALEPAVETALAELSSRAGRLENAAVMLEQTVAIGIAGRGRMADSVFRSVVLQLAATLSPVDWIINAPAVREGWVTALPQARDDLTESSDLRFVNGDKWVSVLLAEGRSDLPNEIESVIEVLPGGFVRAGGGLCRPDLVSREQAVSAVASLAALAMRCGLGPVTPPALPTRVLLSQLHDVGVSTTLSTTLSAPVGIGADGPTVLDLVMEGPHAIVAGTTGSGKSELLLSWVIGMAATRPPGVVSFLFVDFKGGASFGSLVELPHSVGVITDLDTEQALRAMASLAAELRHRERLLARHGLRGIDDVNQAPFARLIIVVDEYAALVESFPALHPLFADIAARGRSLGVHLVLCTQRPPGVVRDGILANCALRISLRVSSAADSVAVLGTDAAATQAARSPGRAFVSAGGAAPFAFQVALSDRTDIDRVISRWAGSDHPSAPWLPPLAELVSFDVLGAGTTPDGIAFALTDSPAEQSKYPAVYRPREHGALLVVGASGSGKSGALAALAASPSTFEVVTVPSELPALWDCVAEALSADDSDHPGTSRVLLMDDLDSALARCQEAYQAPLVQLISRLMRDGPARGTWCVLSAQRVSSALHGLAALCGSQLVLRMPNRAEHALVGAEGTEFVSTLPPGGGFWRGHRVQVAYAKPPSVSATQSRAVSIDVETARLMVVSTRPEQFAAELLKYAPHRRVVPLTPVGFGGRQDGLDAENGLNDSAGLTISAGDTPAILIGDPDVWQSRWTLLGALQRNCEVLFDGCSLAELRALTRSRDLPPPFAPGARTLWIRTVDGQVARATLGGS